MKKYILFDLDGTLTDPKEGITKSVQNALSYFGIEVSDLDQLTKFIGPPLGDSFKMYYNIEQEKIHTAIEKYREYYGVKGIWENMIYEGIPTVLDNLKQSGRTLVVATSKPTVFAEKILEHFDIAKYFTFVAGSELDGTRTNKGEVIAYALKSVGIEDVSDAVMIGDREHDINGAKANGIDSIGVLFGYGDEAELTAAGADYIAKNVDDILEIIKLL